jgi:hypothetical protein
MLRICSFFVKLRQLKAISALREVIGIADSFRKSEFGPCFTEAFITSTVLLIVENKRKSPLDSGKLFSFKNGEIFSC